MTVRTLLASMDSRELLDWMAFYMIKNEQAKPKSQSAQEVKAAMRAHGQRR